MTRSDFPELTVGERVRLEPGGPEWRVVRVTSAAAYVRPVYAVPKTVTIGERTFQAMTGGEPVAIALRSAVIRAEGRVEAEKGPSSPEAPGTGRVSDSAGGGPQQVTAGR